MKDTEYKEKFKKIKKSNDKIIYLAKKSLKMILKLEKNIEDNQSTN